MAEYKKSEELMLTGHEIFDMAKTSRLWNYLQSKFRVDLEILANVLMECEKAGKKSWTDEELMSIAFGLRDVQDQINYQAVVENIVKGTA